MPNRLIYSTSPYLLQHANNPVDWFEWGQDAIGKAKKENKPILVSIGYSACHWCHVMERESFENEAIARIMNEHFVCIKVDREERPDVDQVYMEAVQLLGINGGWPLNVFLTPEQKPFYGGTYFPPQNWSQILMQINQAFRQRRGEIDESAGEIVQHLNKSDLQRFTQESGDMQFRTEQLDKMFNILESRFDKTYGGIEKAPKFVMPTIWLFLLRYFQITGKQEALGMVELTLTRMASAGLYDQVGGGFARYSVDREWFAPHFEKMLYDNGQLLTLYAEMYTITRHQFYKEIITESIEWLEREMKHPEGGFYSALDADSEGAEGKFYVWTYDEILNALDADHHEAAAYFKADKNGNWEHGQNILMRGDESPEKTKKWKADLLKERARRIRPGLDDKILAGWNAITVKGLIDAYLALGETNYLKLAIGCVHFIEGNLMDGLMLFRSFKGKRSDTGGFLEDYAFLIQAYLSLYQATFDEKWIQKANQLCGQVIEDFYDGEQGYFHYSSKQAEQLIARKKEIFDNVIPSSNSVMAHNLFHLGMILDNQDWKEIAHQMVSQLGRTITGEPSYLSNWAILLTEMVKGIAEIAIIGEESQSVNRKLRQHYLPFALLMGTKDKSRLPLLQGKEMINGKTTIFVCYNKSCKLPVTTVEEALAQLSLYKN